MPPDDAVPADAAVSKPKKTSGKRGFLDRGLEDDFTLAGNCHREAVKPEVAPKLLERAWTAANQLALGESLDRCGKIVLRLKALRTGKITRTDEEEADRAELLAALAPILKGARRSYPNGSAERAAYGIGEKLANRSTRDLLGFAAYGFAQLGGAAPKDTLKGVLPAEIAALDTLHQKYRNADFAQADAQKDSATLLAELRAEVEQTLNPLRRDLQGAADQAFTHRDKLNAEQRKAFGLMPDRPLND